MGKSRRMTETESTTRTNIKTIRDIKTKIDIERTETGTEETKIGIKETEIGTEKGTAGRGMRTRGGNTRRDDTGQRDRMISSHKTQGREREAVIQPATQWTPRHFMTHQPQAYQPLPHH